MELIEYKTCKLDFEMKTKCKWYRKIMVASTACRRCPHFKGEDKNIKIITCSKTEKEGHYDEY